MRELAQWLAALPLSRTIRASTWIIPLMQTVHILAIGMILSSIVMIDLRLWGVSRTQPPGALSQRYVPWIWTAIGLLTVTGIALVLSSPPRRPILLDPTFQAKMALMLVALGVTVVLQLALRRGGGRPDDAVPGAVMGVVAALALVLWIAVTFAGRARWITGLLR